MVDPEDGIGSVESPFPAVWFAEGQEARSFQLKFRDWWATH